MRAPDLIDWLGAIAFAGRRLRRTPIFTVAGAAGHSGGQRSGSARTCRGRPSLSRATASRLSA
jgi:hypothetical protein